MKKWGKKMEDIMRLQLASIISDFYDKLIEFQDLYNM